MNLKEGRRFLRGSIGQMPRSKLQNMKTLDQAFEAGRVAAYRAREEQPITNQRGVPSHIPRMTEGGMLSDGIKGWLICGQLGYH